MKYVAKDVMLTDFVYLTFSSTYNDAIEILNKINSTEQSEYISEIALVNNHSQMILIGTINKYELEKLLLKLKTRSNFVILNTEYNSNYKIINIIKRSYHQFKQSILNNKNDIQEDDTHKSSSKSTDNMSLITNMSTYVSPLSPVVVNGFIFLFLKNKKIEIQQNIDLMKVN